MAHEDRTEVLVAGAGPVGMVTALLLAEGGIETTVVDCETRTAAHSHACALHPRVLKLLDRLDLSRELIDRGRRIETMAFYEGATRRAELKLSALPVDFPFALVLPQGDFEDVLERALKQRKHLQVKWSHRLSDVQTQGGTVLAAIDKLAETAKGYSVPDWDWAVEKTLHTSASFVVGADGHNSHLRQCLGIEYERFGSPESFIVYEFESTGDLGGEVRVMLDKAGTNVVWPLLGHTCRWSFQSGQTPPRTEFPDKDRTTIVIDQPVIDQGTREQVQKLLRERAPWFTGSVDELNWSAHVQFERRLAKKFGQERYWLAGDAAHQTGPVGMQSMNAGICEAEALAGMLKKILRDNGPLDLLESYDQNGQAQWQRLLNLKGGLKSRANTHPWVKDHARQILPCIPASGDDLSRLADQIGLDIG